ncbi:hypothetical protein [Ruania albidiflava]|uniref:hypothetical protein n=1 Tax=Ruania albidiflava TaxID=366586 RepID=UPI0003B363CF|nr:hypothetical protein [Ruania albidiflava]
MSRVATAERLIPAAPEEVFAALLDPVASAGWLPAEGMTESLANLARYLES